MWWLYVNDYPDEFGVYEVQPFMDEDEEMVRIEKVVYQKHEPFSIDEMAILSNHDYSRLSDDEREVIQFLLSEGRQ